ncbi:hypothetical protein OTU49_000688 [Cherax quadricarinatus]|uniref:Salivary secreted peptide n=1 Tax=Cherax quadricarinatus TaxID=27406 RepID=A0AAW0XKJ1_CHEQU|nr:uncharacterized protein LOC128689175 [Cherax quadricarinatus]
MKLNVLLTVVCLLVLALTALTEAKPQFFDAVGDFVEDVGEGVGDFFEGVGNFFSNLFGTSRTQSTPIPRRTQAVVPPSSPGLVSAYDNIQPGSNLIIVPD